MANDDDTQQLNQTNGSNSEVIAAIRDLNGRLSAVEEIILARLNDTRPFEHQMMARITELATAQTEMASTQAAILEAIAGIQKEQAVILEVIAGIQKEQTAMREEQVAMRADFGEFRQETNQNFRIVAKKMAILNEDFLSYRAEQALLEKRVDVLEARAA